MQLNSQAGQVKDADNMDKGSSPDITELNLADPEDMVMETKMQTEGTSYTCSVDVYIYHEWLNGGSMIRFSNFAWIM